jgi:mannose-6-phosphate isomerase
MQPEPLYPLRFTPIIKKLIWGGERLGTILGKPIGSGGQYAESWEISDHREDVSVIAEGPLAGVNLRDLARNRAAELYGSSHTHTPQFPLLVKYLDAEQVLSVQVHPDDDLARRLVDDNGKTEAWIVLHAEPDSVIYAGLHSDVTRAKFESALSTGAVEPFLHRIKPRAGDCIMIPAGTVHAIGAGVLLAEIQQMSDATFRVHDWGRLGADGKPRQLHLSEALESIDFQAGPVDPWPTSQHPVTGGVREPLAHCRYFALERLRLSAPGRVGRVDRFTILLGLAGNAEVRCPTGTAILEYGHTLLLPASIGPCDIVPDREAVVLTCVVP